MNLLELPSCNVRRYPASAIPKFAILSSGRNFIHNSHSQPLSDSISLGELLAGSWIIKAADHLAQQGISHVWVADICVGSAYAERDEAIYGIQQRLKRAEVCYVYLDDLPADGPAYDQNTWAKCSFWKQARALPDLLLPSKVEFFDQEWGPRGSRSSPELAPLISSITNITTNVLFDSGKLADIGVGVRMSWAAGRTAIFEEDIAYYLAPILGISIQTRYDEGLEKAFIRLQREVLQDCRDGSVFAWISDDEKAVRGIFAKSPEEFRHFSGPQKKYQWEGPWPMSSSKIRFSNRGIEIQAQMYKLDPYIVVDIGNSEPNLPQFRHRRVGILLRNWGGVYVRAKPALHSVVFNTAPFQMIDAVQNLDDRKAAKVRAYFESKDNSSNLNTTSRAEQHQATTSAGSASPRDTAEAGGMPYTSAQSGIASGNVTPTPAVQLAAATKRDRSGHPIPSSGNRQDQARPPSPRTYRRSISDSESSDSDSSGRSDSDADEYDDEEDEVPEDLDEGPELRLIRPNFVDYMYNQAKSWITSARYTTPPEDRLPPKKRYRTEDWESSGLTKYEEGEDDKVIAHRFDGFYHLACPYYIAKPEKYHKSCLLGYSLESIEDVIRHLIQHHREPPYCPICRREFQSPWVRDQHVRVRTCAFQNTGEVDGVNERQRYRLRKRDKVRLGERARWTRVWGTVFPGVPPPQSREAPYLHGGVDVAVSMMRNYWTTQAPKLAEQYLDDTSRLATHDMQALKAFYRLALDDLLAKVWDDADFRSQDAGTGNNNGE